MRWNDPELGAMSPGRFISIAEQSGLIVELGRWVFEQALDLLADWHDDPKLGRVRLASNAAAAELYSEDYADRVIGGLDYRGVDAGQLEVEVTERVLADSTAMSRADNLKRLCHAGVRLAVDADANLDARAVVSDLAPLPFVELADGAPNLFGSDALEVARVGEHHLQTELFDHGAGCRMPRVLAANGLSRLSELDPKPPFRPYEHAYPV